MSQPELREAASVACPYVGLSADPKTRFSFPVLAHRCYVESRSVAISLSHQGDYCLASQFLSCSRYKPQSEVATAAREPDPLMGPHQPATVGVESASPPGPAPVPLAWGVRRWQVSQPPTNPKANEASRPPVGVFPARDVTAAATLSAAHGGDAAPMASVVLGIMPAKTQAIMPASPPPLTWKDETTLSVLMSILPPMAPVDGAAPTRSAVDATLDLSVPVSAAVRAEGELAPRSAFATGSPVADTRTRLPNSGPFAAAEDVGRTQTYVQIGTLNAPLRSRKRRSGEQRAVLLLLALVVAVALTSLFFAAAYGAFDRFLPTNVVPGTMALSSAASVAVPGLANPEGLNRSPNA